MSCFGFQSRKVTSRTFPFALHYRQGLDNTTKMATAALKRTSLKLGMIPADGIGKEVLPVSVGSVLYVCGPDIRTSIINFSGARGRDRPKSVDWNSWKSTKELTWIV